MTYERYASKLCEDDWPHRAHKIKGPMYYLMLALKVVLGSANLLL